MEKHPLSVWREAFEVGKPVRVEVSTGAVVAEVLWGLVGLVGIILLTVLITVLPWTARAAHAAGTLTPAGSPQQAIQIRDHHVEVGITNGFAKTEVVQTFFNPNATDLEGLYAFPVPKSASLSEFTIFAGESRIDGEVLPKSDANKIYEEEKQQGNDAGVANRNSYQNFEFKVARIPANSETRIRFVYYQPVQVDSGVGKYLYPLEDGGTDDIAKSFWTANEKVEGTLSGAVTLRMAFPIEEVRVPGLEGISKVEKISAEETRVSFSSTGGALNHDVVVYYRLAQNLPGRIEVTPFRSDPNKPGSFMMVLTPSDDVGAIKSEADYTFVLDTSGSMQGKLQTLAKGVRQAIGQLKAQDRFRLISFSDSARALTHGFEAVTPDAVQKALSIVDQLVAAGSTNMYDGVRMALDGLDADRVNSVVLVTDGVTNTGVIDPASFEKLLQRTDVRIFGFLLGNSANWPLMRMVCDVSGGFYAAVSNSDDIAGQLMLAKAKITSEALHDVDLKIDGGGVSEVTEGVRKKLYRGEQVVIFGRYSTPGEAKVTMRARISGEEKVYTTTFKLPDNDVAHPEIERLWALNKIEDIESAMARGKQSSAEGKSAISSLGVEYQLVTDETSMVVLRDEAFTKRGIERRNRARVNLEENAQVARAAYPVYQPRVDTQQPAFSNLPSFHIAGGGGAIPAPFAVAVVGGVLGLARRRRGPRQN